MSGIDGSVLSALEKFDPEEALLLREELDEEDNRLFVENEEDEEYIFEFGD